jgi:hypothetical protein
MIVLLASATMLAQNSRWGSADDPIVKEIAAKEKMWADGHCSLQPDLKDVIADDFQGTRTDGARFGKVGALEFDAKNPDHDCRFGTVKVHFFGDNVAVVYGDESSIRKTDGKDVRRCLAWTDTWLKRDGKWQIVSAQDNAVKCK